MAQTQRFSHVAVTVERDFFRATQRAELLSFYRERLHTFRVRYLPPLTLEIQYMNAPER